MFYSLITILTLGLGELSTAVPVLKYSKYLTFFIFLFLFYQSRGGLDKSSFKSNSPTSPFLLIIICNLFYIWQPNKFLFIDTLIILGAVLPFITTKKIEVNLKLVNISLFILFFILQGFGFNIDFSSDAFFASTTSTAETNILPFLFGLFAISFMLKKEYLFFLLNLVFLVITFKRIVIISVIIAILCNFLKVNRLKYVVIIAVIANCLWLGISYFISTDMFWDLSFMISGLPPGQLTQGRSTRYDMVWSVFEDASFVKYLLGMGAGQVRLILEGTHFGNALQLHNDIMKIFVDLGIFSTIAFVTLLYKGKREIFTLTIFLNVIFFTDNTLIYEQVLFLYLILSYDLIKKRNISLTSRLQGRHYEF